MDGITEQPVSPSDLQSSSPIWHFISSFVTTIELKTPAEGTLTTAELCQHIGSLQQSHDYVEVLWGETSVCSERDLKALGHVMHDWQRLGALCIRGAWTDEKASVFLRHVAMKTSFCTLDIATDPQLRISGILAETQGFSFLRSLRLFSTKLDEDDCRSLKQVLWGHHHGQYFAIDFNSCSFPSFKGYFVVADAAINTGRVLYFCGTSSVGDASIPDSASDSSTMNGESHHTFYNIYEREKDRVAKTLFGKELKGEDLKNHCFTQAASRHMFRYRDLNRAGRLKLLRNEQKPTVRKYVEVLCHGTVRNCAEYLFHFITLNPDVYAAAAVKND